MYSVVYISGNLECHIFCNFNVHLKYWKPLETVGFGPVSICPSVNVDRLVLNLKVGDILKGNKKHFFYFRLGFREKSN